MADPCVQRPCSCASSEAAAITAAGRSTINKPLDPSRIPARTGGRAARTGPRHSARPARALGQAPLGADHPRDPNDHRSTAHPTVNIQILGRFRRLVEKTGAAEVKNVWEACQFSDEIMSGDLELHKFAVELYDVLSGTADPVYSDPRKFLDNTYLTSQMKAILRDVFNRTERSSGVPCIVIDTGFGGGKTHTLMLLYHVLTNRSIGFDYLRTYGLDRELGIDHISKVKVVAIDCRDIKKNTLWGEIADRLDMYEAVEEYDRMSKPITNMEIIKAFFNEPVVLMIDELPHYLSETLGEKVGDTTKSKLTEGFLYKLISASSSSKKAALVVTLTENQQLYKERVDGIKSALTDFVVDGTMNDLKETLSRQTCIMNPVQKEEIYSVICHRLVKKINQNEKNETIGKYMEYYTEEGLITDPKFRERFEKSYPIHPNLIDMLYERVSTISKFNQTRGTLRFLALVLNDIYKRRADCALVGTGDIRLELAAIADELTSKIDRNEYTKIIDTDCIEHARELDNERHVKIIKSIASTIYLNSLHEIPSKKSGITSNQIKIAVGKPGFNASLVDKALHEGIRPRFWYIQETNNQFYFVDGVNENAIIAEHAANVTVSEMDERIQKALERLTAGTSFKATIWNEDVVEDTTSLKLFLFRYNISPSIAKNRISSLIDHVRDKPRNYPNTIAFTWAEPSRVREITESAKELCAIIKARKDERVKADKTFVTNISQKQERAVGNLNTACVRAYAHVGYPDGPELRFDTMPYSDMTGQTIGELVREFLRNKGKLIPVLGHDAIMVESIKNVGEIHNEFVSDKRKKFLEDVGSIIDAVHDGVKKGAFGYSDHVTESDVVHAGIIDTDTKVRYSGFIINKTHLKRGPHESIENDPPRETAVPLQRPRHTSTKFRLVVSKT